ncbi:MAG: DMT family transporter [Candidatus Heimdallarchaeota archaeon]|nr:MAG: DMT family transporter [Candidatus Heimdallarchaeota archaeon]
MDSLTSRLGSDFLVKASIIVILWATPPLVSRMWVGMKGLFPGLFFGFLRYLFGFLALLFILGIRGKLGNLKDLFNERLKPILWCSAWLVLMIVGQNFSVLYLTGASSSVLLNFNPVLIYLFAPLLFIDESYTSKKTLGFVVSTIGIGLIFLTSLETETLSLTDFAIGYILGFLSGVAWAGYSLSLKWFFRESHSEEVTSLNLLGAAILLLLLSLITESLPPFESFTFESIWGLLVIGVGAAAVAFTLYLQLIQKYGPTRAGNIQFLVPLVSLVFAWIFLAEWSLFNLIGGTFCAIGVAMVSYETKNNNNDRLEPVIDSPC